MTDRSRNVARGIFRGLGRLLSALLLLFWGAFFLEHLSEWFLQAEGGFPPTFVWAAQAGHLVMLIGLLIMIRWETPGMIVAYLGASWFAAAIGGEAALIVIGSVLIPIACFALSWAFRPFSARGRTNHKIA